MGFFVFTAAASNRVSHKRGLAFERCSWDPTIVDASFVQALSEQWRSFGRSIVKIGNNETSHRPQGRLALGAEALARDPSP